MQKPALSFWQIWNMSFGFLGIQFGWGLQQANMSAIYAKLGADPDRIPFLWLAGAVTGLVVQPIVGSMSDRTWGRLGRRRPYFLAGSILAAIALFIMPHSSAIWIAASLLWILDASINVCMEPFRAFVADKLNVSQRTAGFVMQSFFIGVGASCANAMPHLFRLAGVTGQAANGVPLTVLYSFQLGAGILLAAVLWTIFTTDEAPPHDMAAFEKRRAERSGVAAIFHETFSALGAMPRTMKQLAVVQVFTWLGLFCMWTFFGLATARQVFGATDAQSPSFDRGIEWGGTSFACYSIVCFLVAFALPRLAALTSRKTVHAAALVCGGLGLLATFFIRDQYLWLLTMVGVGIAWASILTMPYAMLAGCLPPERMGVYMGVFNLFIVLPNMVASLTFQPLVKHVFHNNPLWVVMMGGACLLLAAVSVAFVDDHAEDPISSGAVLAGDRHETFTTTETAQPVPSTGLIDGKKRT
jgi:maltose/moltooligosaccharide transporter